MDGKQLKNSILQWAIQGKLIPQNPKDEPAQKLLERIAASRNGDVSLWSEAIGSSKNSKKSLSTSLRGPCKGTKQSKNQPSRIYCENGVWYEQIGSAAPKDVSDEIPFEIPESWAWCRIGDIFYHTSGKQQSSSNKKGTPQKFITTSNLYWGRFVLDNVKVMNFTDEEIKSCSATKGDLLVCEGGAGYGRSAIWNENYDICLQNHIHRLRPCVNGICEYVYYFIYLLKETNRLISVGTAMPGLSANRLKGLILPFPPLAEQKRIVAKLEQVLPLAEEYGAAQEQLDKLNKELPEALKKSILQEAFQGKLVPQNPKDEPAQILLERIAASRNESSLSLPKGTSSTSLRGAKATKQSKDSYSRIYRENGFWYEQIGSAAPKDITDEIPFEIPETWVWCRLGSICDYLHRGKSPVYSDKKILPVMAQKCNQWDKIYTEKCLFADPKTIEKYTTEQYLQVGDVIINSTGGGTVGRTGLVDEYVFSEYDKFVADSHVTVVRSNKNVNSKYVYYFLITPLIQRGIEERCSGSTNQIELGTETVKNYLFPLPPLAEQKRIVAKLEQLFKVL